MREGKEKIVEKTWHLPTQANKVAKSRIERIIESAKGPLVLDIGAGQSFNTVALRKSFPKVISVDRRKRNKDTGERIDTACDVLNGLPFPDSYADTIVAGEFLEHLLKPYEFLLECKRVLKRNGRLIMTTPNATGYQNVFRSRGRRTLTAHCYCWSPDELNHLVRKSGFEIVKTETFFERFWFLNFLPMKFKSTMLIVCKSKK